MNVIFGLVKCTHRGVLFGSFLWSNYVLLC